MDLPNSIDVRAARNGGESSIRLPSSKSILRRQLFISALADQPTHLVGCDQSTDSDSLTDALQSLGVRTTFLDKHPDSLAQCGWGTDPTHRRLAGDRELHLQTSGVSLRLLLALSAIY